MARLYQKSGFPLRRQVAAGRLSSEAYSKWGKGFHAARLNFGDCFAYATAKSLNAPILYVGGDFGKTDIIPAMRT